jgi:hypothetical protein
VRKNPSSLRIRAFGAALALITLQVLGTPGCAQGESLAEGSGGAAGQGGQPDMDAAAEDVISDIQAEGPDGSLDAVIDVPAEASDDVVSEPAVGACQCDSPGCGTCPTVAMISVTGFQIDSIEVTNGQYAAFLAANPDVSEQVAACSSNLAFEPSQGWPGEIVLPVTSVDWCDARAFCHWARKRLCGAVGGGPGSYDDFDHADTDQWQRACSGAGARAYPYGNTYDGATCNGADLAKAEKIPAGEVTCQGAYPGLFDMSGNVWEWEDACQSDTSASLCRIRGGSYLNGAPNLRCDTDSSASRLDGHPTVGFRCCRN